jgi:hypothetical protein
MNVSGNYWYYEYFFQLHTHLSFGALYHCYSSRALDSSAWLDFVSLINYPCYFYDIFRLRFSKSFRFRVFTGVNPVTIMARSKSHDDNYSSAVCDAVDSYELLLRLPCFLLG